MTIREQQFLEVLSDANLLHLEGASNDVVAKYALAMQERLDRVRFVMQNIRTPKQRNIYDLDIPRKLNDLLMDAEIYTASDLYEFVLFSGTDGLLKLKGLGKGYFEMLSKEFPWLKEVRYAEKGKY